MSKTTAKATTATVEKDSNNNGDTTSSTLSPEPYDGTQLKELLDNVNPAGSFATSGTFSPNVLCPRIMIDGIDETIGLPLHSLMANHIKNTVAEKAPFGRGPETLLDETVRKAWQIDPSKVQLGGDGWNDTVKKIVKRASYNLGISNENVEKLGIAAHLYKVLLYEKGGHFKPHKDTVKEEGMFGTLVLQLPSRFQGSDSVVSHQGTTKRIKLSEQCETSFRYMAFYGDCEHEIEPVEDGWRFCLVYNLVVTKPDTTGVVPDATQMESTVEELRVEAVKWLTSSTGKIGYCLDHEYTLDSFSFGKLKGRDAVVLSVLRAAVYDTGKRMFDLALAIFYHKSYYGAYDSENEYGMEKIVFEDGKSHLYQCWRKQKGVEDMKKSPVWCDRLMYPSKDGFIKELQELSEGEQERVEEIKDYGELAIGKPYEGWKEHHDAGNEGGGETTWYRSACIIFRPTASMKLNDTVVSICNK